jgi:hypothetical protein
MLLYMQYVYIYIHYVYNTIMNFSAATVSAVAASPVTLMLCKLCLFVNLLNQSVLTLSDLT